MSGMSSCRKVTCGLPEVFPHTSLTQPSSALQAMSYNDAIDYKCHPGHTIGGSPNGMTGFSIKCQASGEHSAPQVCKPVKCGLAPLLDKAKAGVAASLYYGMSVGYQCDKGHTVTGSPDGANAFTLTCNDKAKFSGFPSQEPCKPVSAGPLPAIDNAELKEYNGGSVSSILVVAYYPAGFKYQCKPGYSLTGSSGGATYFMAHITSIGTIVPSLPDKCKRITYSIQGEVKDARTGAGLAGTIVTIVGTGQQAVAAHGFFTFSNVPKGNVTLKYEKNGYIESQQLLYLQADLNNGGAADVSMSPRMSSSQWRATIKWAARPLDLDTYVKWGWSKMYYGTEYRSASGLAARLEKDDTDGYGPETAYITGVGQCRGNAYKCDIKYMINDFQQSGKMPDISAEVMLYTGDRVAGTWKLSDCPKAVSRDKNWWHVFTIDGKTNKLKWHCSQGSGGEYLLHAAGHNTTKDSTEVDFESYRGPFPGRLFRHSQHKPKVAVQQTMPRLRSVNKVHF